MADQLATYVQADRYLAHDIIICFIQAMYKARAITRVSGARSTLSNAHLYRRGPLLADPTLARMQERRSAALAIQVRSRRVS